MLEKMTNLGEVLSKSQQQSIHGGVRVHYGCRDGSTGTAVIDNEGELKTLCGNRGGTIYFVVNSES